MYSMLRFSSVWQEWASAKQWMPTQLVSSIWRSMKRQHASRTGMMSSKLAAASSPYSIWCLIWHAFFFIRIKAISETVKKETMFTYKSGEGNCWNCLLCNHWSLITGFDMTEQLMIDEWTTQSMHFCHVNTIFKTILTCIMAYFAVNQRYARSFGI